MLQHIFKTVVLVSVLALFQAHAAPLQSEKKMAAGNDSQLAQRIFAG